MKVLIADDERISREGLKAVIEELNLGLEVVCCAKDGLSALNYIQNNSIDILITDIRMPNMDGLELIKNISLKKYDISVIILSGYDDFSYAQKAIQYGVTNYLLKPVRIEELEKSLKMINDKRSEGILRILVDEKVKQRFEKEHKEDFDNIVKDLIFYEHKFDILKTLSLSNDLFMLIKLNNYPVAMYKRVIIKAINKIIRSVQDELEYELAFLNDTERLMDISVSKSYEEIKEKFDTFLSMLGEYLIRVNKENSGSIVYRLQQIVKKDYSNKNLTLNSIAQELKLTPNYLGRLFKEETGESFSDYLEELRMNNAIKLLKTSSSKKVYEVADECGYNDGQYFAKVFKKYTGYTPNNYRKK